MDMNKLTKLSLAFAIICAVTCGIAIAPLIVLAIFALVALLCLLVCVTIYLVGGLLWLVTFSALNVFPVAESIGGFGTSIFTYMVPIARFSCFYITPYASCVAIAAGVLGIIISAVALARAKNDPKSEQPQEAAKPQQMLDSTSEDSVSSSVSLSDEESESVHSGGIFDPYSVYNAEGKAVREKEKKGKKEKKPRVKKTKTFKSICISSLIVSIVFTVVAVAAVIFAYNCEGIFV